MARQEPSLLTTGQAAKLCGVTPDTILKWIKNGRLRGVRTSGGHFRISRLDLEAQIPSTCPEDLTSQSPLCFPQILRCWEYLSGLGEVREECKQCVVYKVRATRCFVMARLGPEVGHARRFCQSSCQDCVYYRRVQGLATGVLVITPDEHVIESLYREQHPNLAFRGARNAYEASAIVQDFRPAFAVVDEVLLAGPESDLADSLANDPRIPGLRIILMGSPRRTARTGPTTRHSLNVDVLEKPWTVSQIVEVINRYPVDFLPGEGDNSEGSIGKEQP